MKRPHVLKLTPAQWRLPNRAMHQTAFGGR